jgi:hypothetical protein
MPEQVNLNAQIIAADGTDVTGQAPFFQEIPVDKFTIQRIQNLPTDSGEIPNYLLTITLGNDKPLEKPTEPPKSGDVPKTTRKQTPAQRNKALNTPRPTPRRRAR